MSIAQHIVRERFYGAKSQTIRDVSILRSRSYGPHTLALTRINDTLYQLFVDEEGRDVLAGHVTEVQSGFGEWISERPFPAGPFRPLGVEQSNSSFITTTGPEPVILKYFRRLEPGLNPDVEILGRIPDCPYIAPLLGHAVTEINGETYTLVMAQRFIDGADAWRLALDSADFEDEAHAIGVATAGVHRALATAFPTHQLPAPRISELLNERLDYTVTLAPELKLLRPAARALLNDLHGAVEIQRIHGDLHLGQVLRAGDRYVLIDFEGEPARPMAARTRPDSVLRDIAGIFRSFDYARHCATDRVDRGAGWTRAMQGAFLEGYGITPDPVLLNAYLLDKALYEVAYETNHRPAWVHIPLSAVTAILDDSH